MPEPLVIVGAGGFGREILDVVRAINEAAVSARWEVLGVLDDCPSAENLTRLARQEVPYLGTVDEHVVSRRETSYVVGVGAPVARRAVADKLDAAGNFPATLVHPQATIGADVSLGPGTIVCAGARVMTNVGTGRHVHLDVNVTVGHDTVVGDFARLNPGSSVSGDCSIGDEVLIGVAAAVINQIRVGEGATVGGSACVVADVPPSAVVKGVPAR